MRWATNAGTPETPWSRSHPLATTLTTAERAAQHNPANRTIDTAAREAVRPAPAKSAGDIEWNYCNDEPSGKA
jgi:hypothetical protein